MPDFEDSVRTAENEARRFLRRVKEWREEAGSEFGNQHSAAIKRASMDLSRALVDVRKGNA